MVTILVKFNFPFFFIVYKALEMHFYDQGKFEYQLNSYKQDTELTILLMKTRFVPCICLHQFNNTVRILFQADFCLFSFILSMNK